jgi:hypothetical protein
VITYEMADGTIVLADVEFTTAADERAMIATASPRAARALRGQFAAARAEEAAMNRRATVGQKAITWGDCVTRQWDDPEHGPVTIWGTIQPLALVQRDDREHGAGEAEIAALAARLEDGYRRGWRYGRWHSVISPEGEYGAAHVADLRPVPGAEFDAAQWNGWRP